MFDLSDIAQTAATDRPGAGTELDDYDRGKYAHEEPAAIDLVFRWALRLALPLVVLLSMLVLYWIWFDIPSKRSWLQIAGTLPLLVNTVLVAIWAACTWV